MLFDNFLAPLASLSRSLAVGTSQRPGRTTDYFVGGSFPRNQAIMYMGPDIHRYGG
jgi:hypothetical protein